MLGVTAELLGGMLLAAGLATRAAAVVLIALTLVIDLEYRALAEHRDWLVLLGGWLLLGAGLYSLCVLILMVLGVYRVDGINPLPLILPSIAMAISSSVFEELLHRGVIFRNVEELAGSWIALLLSALIFGLRHLGNPCHRCNLLPMQTGCHAPEQAQRHQPAGSPCQHRPPVQRSGHTTHHGGGTNTSEASTERPGG